jgi:hypothetical protein
MARRRPYTEEVAKKPFVIPSREALESVVVSYNNNPRNDGKPKISFSASMSDENLYQLIFEAHEQDIEAITQDIIQKNKLKIMTQNYL